MAITPGTGELPPATKPESPKSESPITGFQPGLTRSATGVSTFERSTTTSASDEQKEKFLASANDPGINPAIKEFLANNPSTKDQLPPAVAGNESAKIETGQINQTNPLGPGIEFASTPKPAGETPVAPTPIVTETITNNIPAEVAVKPEVTAESIVPGAPPASNREDLLAKISPETQKIMDDWNKVR